MVRIPVLPPALPPLSLSSYAPPPSLPPSLRSQTEPEFRPYVHLLSHCVARTQAICRPLYRLADPLVASLLDVFVLSMCVDVWYKGMLLPAYAFLTQNRSILLAAFLACFLPLALLWVPALVFFPITLLMFWVRREGRKGGREGGREGERGESFQEIRFLNFPFLHSSSKSTHPSPPPAYFRAPSSSSSASPPSAVPWYGSSSPRNLFSPSSCAPSSRYA